MNQTGFTTFSHHCPTCIFINLKKCITGGMQLVTGTNVCRRLQRRTSKSNFFRSALTRNQDFITETMLDKWGKKTLENENLEKETLRNCFKLIHRMEFTAKEKDKIFKLLTRKPLFNCQHKNVFPNQPRPEWAREDFCWDCKEVYGEERREDLLHSLWTCQAKLAVKGEIFNILRITPAPLQVTTQLLWGKFFAHQRTDNSCVNALGNIINWIATLEFLNA
jgi:hypothetical protein